MYGRGDGREGQLEECMKGFGLGKGNGSGLKEVEGERKGELLPFWELGENLRELLERKQKKKRGKNVSESKE